MPTTALFLFDMHCGGTTAVCTPDVLLPDEGIYKASAPQLWLLECYKSMWKEFKAMQRPGDDTLVVFGGDELDGGRRRVGQRIAGGNMAIQRQIFYDLLDIGLEISGPVDGMMFCAGTPFHAGADAEDEWEIAGRVGGIYFRQKPVADKLDLKIDGVHLWVQHHSWGAQRPWTVGANADRMAAAIIAQQGERNWPIPDLVLCGHRHIISDSGETFIRPRVVISGAFQLMTEWVRKTTAGIMLADTGGILVRFEKGQYDLKVKRFSPEPDEPMVWPPADGPTIIDASTGRRKRWWKLGQ